ncbi:MAG: ABC transporter ATP-binding protein [Planctomycetes bacterium]|nr:ABC transporter ATP-binding protein [Planctomycetota bacterium]
MTEAVIRVEDVHKRFGRGFRAVDALRGVTLSVAPGEIYGLLGRNGAGKTTIVKILLDIVRADRGRTWLRDRPSRSPRSRQEVGYLPEDHKFPEYQTGAGALAYYAALSGRGGAALRGRVGELLDLVDLSGAARKKIRTYSKGMKQRLGLAQALAHDPRILFLDEPTDGVDPVGRARIRDLLIRLKGEGKTIFLNSHLLGETERVCDRVGILERGALIREGTIEALTTTDQVYRIRTDPRPTPELVGALGERGMSATACGDDLDVAVERKEDIDPIIDFLRSRGIGIRSLLGKKLSLEEVFLAAVDEDRGRREGGR